LKLVSGLSTKEYGLRAVITYFLAVLKAVDEALLAQNGFFLLVAAGEGEGGGSCQNEDGELHAWEWIDVDGVAVGCCCWFCGEVDVECFECLIVGGGEKRREGGWAGLYTHGESREKRSSRYLDGQLRNSR